MRTRSALPLVACFLILSASAARAQEPSSESARAKDVVDETPDAASAEALRLVIEERSATMRAALEHNARVFDQILLQSTEATIRQQKFAAAAGITGGMVMLGLAAWRLIENDPQSAYSRGLGVMFMTLGMADLTTGVYAATRVSHEKRRLERWERARENGVTPVELAHFEGELQSSSETRNGERLLLRWNGLTHAIAGGLILAFTPIPDGSSRTDRVAGYIVGGLFFGVGMGTFAASFRPTPSEKAWSEYNKRKMSAPGHEFSWRISPSFSRRGGALSFGATF